MKFSFSRDRGSNVFDMLLNVGCSFLFLDVWANSNDVSFVLEDSFAINIVNEIIHEFNESFESSLILDL